MAIEAVQLQTNMAPDQPFAQPYPNNSQASHPHSIRRILGESTEYASEVPVSGVVAPPGRVSDYVMRALYKPGDTPPIGSSVRAEWHHSDHFPAGEHMRLSTSLWVPQDYYLDVGSNFLICSQIHPGGSQSPYVGIRLGFPARGGAPADHIMGAPYIILTRRTPTTASWGEAVWTMPLTEFYERWRDLVIDFRSHTSEGYLRLYVDGEQVYNSGAYNSNPGPPATGTPTSSLYSKNGGYGHGHHLYFGWWKTMQVSDDGDYYADVAPPGSSGGDPEPPPTTPKDGDASPVTRVHRGTAYNAANGATTTLTIPDVEIDDGRSLIVGGAGSFTATGKVVSSVTWNGEPMTIIGQYENDIVEAAPLVGFIAELHLAADEPGGIGDVVITFSDNYTVADAVATEVWDISPAVSYNFDEGQGTTVEDDGLATTQLVAAMVGYLWVNGDASDNAPDLGGALSVAGQRSGGPVNATGGNVTTNEGYGSQVESATRHVRATLSTTERVWTSGLAVFPVALRELPETWKRYASLAGWGIPGVPV